MAIGARDRDGSFCGQRTSWETQYSSGRGYVCDGGLRTRGAWGGVPTGRDHAVRGAAPPRTWSCWVLESGEGARGCARYDETRRIDAMDNQVLAL